MVRRRKELGLEFDAGLVADVGTGPATSATSLTVVTSGTEGAEGRLAQVSVAHGAAVAVLAHAGADVTLIGNEVVVAVRTGSVGNVECIVPPVVVAVVSSR